MSVSNVLDRVRDTFPQISDQQFERIINDVHAELTTRYKLKPTTVTISTLVANTAEYAVANSIAKIWTAEYHRSSTSGDYAVLDPTSVDELDAYRDDWRTAASSEPREVYYESGKIGLVPAPDTSSSGSPPYPRVVLRVSGHEALTTSSSLPAWLPSHDPWVYGVLYRYAHTLGTEGAAQAEYFRSLYHRACIVLSNIINSRLARLKPQSIPEGAVHIAKSRRTI